MQKSTSFKKNNIHTQMLIFNRTTELTRCRIDTIALVQCK